MVRMALKLWKLTLEPYQSFSENDAPVGLHHAKHRLPNDVLPAVINGLVLSIVRYGYCVNVYDSASKQVMHRIQKVLNFCARVLSGRRKYDHISDVLAQLGWLSAHNLYMYRCICLLRQALATGEPATIAQSITPTMQVHDRCTRASEQQLLRLPAIGRRTDGRIRTGPSSFDAPNAGTTMTHRWRTKRWNDDASRGATCHVARSTCRRANPYENKRWGKIFEGEIAEIPNLQDMCALVWSTYHACDDPEGSRLGPQGAIFFFSPMPSSSDTLGPRVTKFGTQVKTNKGYSSIQILGGSKN